VDLPEWIFLTSNLHVSMLNVTCVSNGHGVVLQSFVIFASKAVLEKKKIAFVSFCVLKPN
jgi:hypothetical protein